MNKNTIIFDLDGTLADIEERKQKAQWNPMIKQWIGIYSLTQRISS